MNGFEWKQPCLTQHQGCKILVTLKKFTGFPEILSDRFPDYEGNEHEIQNAESRIYGKPVNLGKVIQILPPIYEY